MSETEFYYETAMIIATYSANIRIGREWLYTARDIRKLTVYDPADWEV